MQTNILNAKSLLSVLAVVLAVAVVIAFSPLSAIAGKGNDMPSGPHYNLNIIGVSKDKNDNTEDDWGGNGHRIFVNLEGNTKIELSEGDFKVLDGNGTDGTAAFQLPNPDPDNSGVTEYSVFVRALGTPGGSATMTTCAYDPADGSLHCNTGELVVGLERGKGKPVTQNVSKELLYLWDVDLDGDGVVDLNRVPLFDAALEGYFWDYNNNGLKVAQLRFYPCSTYVGETSGDPIEDVSCF